MMIKEASTSSPYHDKILDSLEKESRGSAIDQRKQNLDRRVV